jgi:hypothetical protein
MESAVGHTGAAPQARHRLRRPKMPWGGLAAFEFFALALLSGMLVLVILPGMFDVEWGCFGPTGGERTAADTYVGVFAVGGALGWLVTGGLTAVAYSTGRRGLALLFPLAWFGVLVLTSLIVAVSIGPLPC